jgi:hypothetical protein
VKISEAQMETWSHQGSVAQSAATYAQIKKVLEDSSAPFANRSFEIFLQGSYGNDTNIYADSDVDIVICLTSTYYEDLGWLQESEKSFYNQIASPASYSLPSFRDEVLTWLKGNFGSAVNAGNKAIFIKGSESRRDADVLVCAAHRLYRSYKEAYSSDYHRGVVFWTTSGTEIVNFPKQHSDNCTVKQQNTCNKFKQLVRSSKNLRNKMVVDGALLDGSTPSYFLEGLLWNMPSDRYTYSLTQTVDNLLAWLSSCDVSSLHCANHIHYLVRDGHPVCWPTHQFEEFVTGLKGYWT